MEGKVVSGAAGRAGGRGIPDAPRRNRAKPALHDFPAGVVERDLVVMTFDQRLGHLQIKRPILPAALLNERDVRALPRHARHLQVRDQVELDHAHAVVESAKTQIAGGLHVGLRAENVRSAQEDLYLVMFRRDRPFVLFRAGAAGLQLAGQVREVPDAIGLAVGVEVQQRRFFRSRQHGHGAPRIQQESQIVVFPAVQEGPERAALRRIVQLRQDFGVVVGNVFVVEHPLERSEPVSQCRLAPLFQDVPDAPEGRLVPLGRFVGQLGALFDFIESGVAEVDHHGGEVFVHGIGPGDAAQMFDRQIESRLQLENAVAHEHADGHLAQHRRQETEGSRAERKSAHIALERQVVDAIYLDELAAAQRLVVRVGVGERRTFARDLNGLGENLQLQGNAEVDGLVRDGDGALPRFEAVLCDAHGVRTRGGCIEVEAALRIRGSLDCRCARKPLQRNRRAGNQRAAGVFHDSG